MLNKLAAKELPELKGLDIVVAAKLAHKKGKQGNTKFNFERTELLRVLINSWNKHEEWMTRQQQQNINGENETQLNFPEIDPATAARFFCQYAKNRTFLAN